MIGLTTWPASAWLPCPVPGCHSKLGAPTLEVPCTTGRGDHEVQEPGPFTGRCTSCGEATEGIPYEQVQEAVREHAAQQRLEGY